MADMDDKGSAGDAVQRTAVRTAGAAGKFTGGVVTAAAIGLARGFTQAVVLAARPRHNRKKRK